MFQTTHRILFILCLYLALLFITTGDRACAADLTIARQKWDEYMTLAQSFQGTVSESTRRFDGPTALIKRKSSVRHLDGCAMLTTEATVHGKEEHQAVLYGRRYMAILSRTANNKPWVLTHFGGPKSESQYQDDAWDAKVSLALAPLTLVYPREVLSDIVVDPAFKVNRLETFMDTGRDFVRVHFEFGPKQVSRGTIGARRVYPGRISLQNGEVVLDPANYYLIRSFRVVMRPFENEEVFATGDYKYVAGPNHVPLLTAIHRTFEGGRHGSRDGSEQSMEYNLTQAQPRESELELAAFGIPEPATSVRGSSSRYVWILAAALTCLVLATVFRTWANRRVQRENV